MTNPPYTHLLHDKSYDFFLVFSLPRGRKRRKSYASSASYPSNARGGVGGVAGWVLPWFPSLLMCGRGRGAGDNPYTWQNTYLTSYAQCSQENSFQILVLTNIELLIPHRAAGPLPLPSSLFPCPSSTAHYVNFLWYQYSSCVLFTIKLFYKVKPYNITNLGRDRGIDGHRYWKNNDYFAISYKNTKKIMIISLFVTGQPKKITIISLLVTCPPKKVSIISLVVTVPSKKVTIKSLILIFPNKKVAIIHHSLLFHVKSNDNFVNRYFSHTKYVS
jgi:hypothetical protein